MRRGELTDEQWEKLQPLLPPQKPKRGRPTEDHRRVLNGILWILRTGAPWRDMPERYGPHQTCHDRFSRWQRSGLWNRILQAIQSQEDHTGSLVWTQASVDSSVVRAHQHAAGARRNK